MELSDEDFSVRGSFIASQQPLMDSFCFPTLLRVCQLDGWSARMDLQHNPEFCWIDEASAP